MQFFKATINVKTRKSWYERIMFIRSEDIIGAMVVTKKVRGSSLNLLKTITYEEYMKGVKSKA